MSSSSDLAILFEPLKDIITAEEGQIVTLECKLSNYISSAEWYKDGVPIESCYKTKIRNEGLWQILEIKSVDKDDEGLYSFAVKTTTYTYTKCMLFVKPRLYDNVTHNFSDNKGQGVGEYLNVRSVNHNIGAKFKLHVEFSKSIERCTWYKNNRPMHPRYSKLLLDQDEHTRCRLSFLKPGRTDSGLYCVVAQTADNKYICSYADILIASNYIKGFYNNYTIPHALQGPNNFIEVYDQDIVRLMFKVNYDNYTILEWTKDGTEVKFNVKIKCETYCNRYIALKIRGVTIADSGKYYMILRDKTSSNTVIGSTRLDVKKYKLRPAKCTVTESLLTAMVIVGNGVTFRASFNIPEPKLNYVVWNVGHYDIEKSSSKFKVLCDGGTFILHIPMVTPEMNGEVCCQLRQFLPPQQSILLCSTTAYLIVVPSPVLKEVNELNITVKRKNIYSDSIISLVAHGANSNFENMAGPSRNDILMDFQFSRLNGENFYFDVVNKEEGSEILVSVTKNAVSDPNALFPTLGDWSISWVRSNRTDWYTFELCQPNGQYMEIGKSSSPSIDIKEPEEDKLFKFRVRRLQIKKKGTNKKFIFVPHELQVKDSRSKKILRYNKYKNAYSNSIKIGRGTFGCVNLIYSRNGDALASKTSRISKRSKRNKWRQPFREFEITKTLSHPNTLSVINGFLKNKPNGFIMSMEYLWGGQLFDVINERESLAEVDVIVYARQILLALEYIHSKKIVHLDIKPQNILLVNRNSRRIKLIDFGMARIVEQPVRLTTMYGSRDFMPPEMINGDFIGIYCDMWSFGVLTFWLLTGTTPFIGRTWNQKSSYIRQGLYAYEDTHHRSISDRGKKFISYLLRTDPDDRMTAVMALNNRWITHGPSEGQPKKIAIPGRGGIVIVSDLSRPDEMWKFIMYQILAVVRFRSMLRRNPHRGQRRFSARLLARRRSARGPPGI